MSRNPLKIKIAYLYPDILQSLCDRANIDVFIKRANWRNIEVKVDEINTNDKILPSAKYDFYYIGGSNNEAIGYCLQYLKKNQDELKIAARAYAPMLAVNCGYQMFGNKIQQNNKAPLEGIKILNVDSFAAKKICYGYISGYCNFLKNKSIVGFENHSMITSLGENTVPFLILKNRLNNPKTDGAKFNNVIGTYLTSPIFAQNPNLCDFFIAASLRIKYKYKIPLTRLYDDIEWFSHEYIENNSK